MLTAAMREEIGRNRRRFYAALGEEHRLVWVTREIADRAVAGDLEFQHLGVQYFHIGRSDIAWHGPHHHHVEWRAQLNRFFHLPSLAAAYRETGDERYAEAARDYLVDWIRAHPTRSDWAMAEYDNSLNLSIRALEWTFTLADFLPSPAFDYATVDAILTSLAVQLVCLGAHLAPGINWRIAQADTLLTCAICLPFLEGAVGWQALAIHVLNDAYHRQILPDGAHIERNPGYHHWMTNVFDRLWRLDRAMPELGLAMQADVIARMHDYNLGTLLPNGATNGVHDSNNRRTGPLDTMYLDSYVAFRREAGLSAELPPLSQYFPNAGQACFRSGWDADAVCLTYDATTWGGPHCHLSRNSLQLYAYGRHLLLDPGTLTYECTDPMMALGKGTRAHNTLNLNGWNQSAANPTGTRCASLPGYDVIMSVYEGGYWPGLYRWNFFAGHGAGMYGEHFRALLWVRDRCAIVIDHLRRDGGASPTLESNWQLCEGPVDVDADGRRAVTRHPDANLLLLFPQATPGMRLTVHEGETDPPRGWLQGEGEYVTAPQLCLSTPALEPMEAQLLTVLVPFRSTAEPGVEAEAAVDSAGVQTLRLRWADGATDELFATPRLESALNTIGDITTDAALVHLRRDAAGAVTGGLVVDGTYLHPYQTKVKAEMGVWSF